MLSEGSIARRNNKQIEERKKEMQSCSLLKVRNEAFDKTIKLYCIHDNR
jgi:hypothetical protein